ncbi:MAG: sulfatase [Deltaproteobacteria bacterium]|nr:sulfatase [Deltaproteobacteria bacterium]MCW5804878.1 sulfatase [Deltaproteobacteria bacterium]
MRPDLVVAIAVFACACGSKSDAPGGGSAPAPAPSDAAVAAHDAAPAPKPEKKPGRAEHAVWNLVDNRHAAHRYADGDLVIDAADVGLARYMRFAMPAARWHLGHTVGGKRAAVADRVATLEVPLSDEAARAIGRVSAHVHGTAKQAVTLFVNGKKVPDSRVVLEENGWQKIALPVAPGMLGVGENRFGFEVAGGKDPLAFEWIAIGHRPGAILLPHATDPRTSATFDAKADAITLAKDAALIWYVTIPDGAHLVADVDGPCKVDVQARASDGSFAGGLLTETQDRVDLTRMAGRVVGLIVTTRECATATLRHPRITLHGPAPTVVEKAEPPKYILLWVMDALRADKVPIFTPGARAQTPNLDELAKSSVVYRQFYVQGNESQTSHTSVWTSVYPVLHKVRMQEHGGTWRIDDKFPLLAERLAAAGMYTAAVTGNGFVLADSGYGRGFKEFRNMMREPAAFEAGGILYGQDILDAVLARLDAHRVKGPTYLFFGTVDTHAPWISRRPWVDVYSPNYEGPFKDFASAKDLGFLPDSMGCSITPPPKDIERLRAIYDSAISYHDAQLGRLVKQLTAWGIWDQTMLVITADHGDELFEDGRCGHGESLRDSLIRVPLLIHYPARFQPAVIDEGAEGVDIMPTMLDAMNAPAMPTAQGESLLARARVESRGWVRPSYSSMQEFAHAMRIGRWKVRVGATGVPILQDLVADPDEKVDLAATRPVERRMMTDNFGMFLALRKQWTKRTWGVTTNLTAEGAAALDGLVTP